MVVARVVVVGSGVTVVGALTGAEQAVMVAKIAIVAARAVDIALMVSAAPVGVFSLVR